MGTSLSVLEQEAELITWVIQIAEVCKKFHFRSKVPQASPDLQQVDFDPESFLVQTRDSKDPQLVSSYPR